MTIRNITHFLQDYVETQHRRECIPSHFLFAIICGIAIVSH